MTLEIRKVGRASVLRFDGEMRIGVGDVLLRREFRAQIEGGARRFLFDLRSLRFMDSAGVGEMVACAKRAADNGGVIKLLPPRGGSVARVLEITSLDRVFETFDDEAAALASFTS